MFLQKGNLNVSAIAGKLSKWIPLVYGEAQQNHAGAGVKMPVRGMGTPENILLLPRGYRGMPCLSVASINPSTQVAE
jgi:hypothetical protein